MRVRALGVFALALTACTSSAHTAESRPIGPLAQAGLPDSHIPAPDRPVASVVSPSWDTETERDRVKEAETVMTFAGITNGSHVADIGAGSGYYTLHASRRVGSSGVVYAEDIMPSYLTDLAKRVSDAGARNVTLVRGDPSDPRLPPASVDRVLMVHMYHEIVQPYALLYNLYPSLMPGARIAIVDLDRATAQHGTPPARLKCELHAAGYDQVDFKALAYGYVALFTPTRHESPAETRAELQRAPCYGARSGS